MNTPAKLLASFTAAVVLSAVPSLADEEAKAASAEETKEIEIAVIRVQRRDAIEYSWGEQNDVDELTYSVNNDGTASLYIGTEDGTKKVVDPDAIGIVKPYRLEKADFVVYPVQPADATQPVIQTGDNKFSPWNYITGSTTNYQGKPGVTGQTRTIKVRSVNQDVKITKVVWSWNQRGQTPLGPSNWAQTTINDQDEDEFAVEHSLLLTTSYMNMNDNPPGGDITIEEVYGYAGDTRNSKIDCSVADVTVMEQDGRTYRLGRMHETIENIHKVQDRWAYYQAARDVNFNDHKVQLDHDGFAFFQSDGALGGNIGSDIGPIISWDRGNSQGGRLIKGFEVNTNGTVTVYVTTKFGAALTVQACATVNGTYADVATTNGGIIDYDGGKAYKLTAAQVNNSAGFYKVKATISNEDVRAASITMHAATYFVFGGKTYAPVVNGTKLEFVEQ